MISFDIGGKPYVFFAIKRREFVRTTVTRFSMYRLDTVNLKPFVGKVLLSIKRYSD